MGRTECIYSSVSEHDMDVMFLQLFSIDEGFLKLFLDESSLSFDKASVISIELSKTDSRLGESDITVIVEADKKRIALLIEDKIDAIAMPGQPERYIKRGNIGIDNKEYDEFKSYIVCPQKYYDNNEVAREYPYMLTYETIRDYLIQNESQLYYTYYQQISQAIDKARKPAQVVLNEKANSFFCKYKDYQEANYPSLDLRTKRDSNGYWAQYSTRLGNAYLHHKIQEGKVDLTFSNASVRMNEVDSLAAWLRNHGIDGARSLVAGKAGVIHLDVPKLNMEIPFSDNNEQDIIKCFEAIVEMTDTANIFALAGDLAKTID